MSFLSFDLHLFSDEPKQEKSIFQRFSRLSFPEYCTAVEYPPPFKKQIEAFNFSFNDTGSPRMVLGARGYGKTDYLTVLGSAHTLTKDPQYEILIVTKEQERGKDLIAEIREVLNRAGATFRNNSKRKIILEGKKGKEPNVLSLTIRSKGFRGRHPDLIIMDDPITPDDCSEAERLRVKKTYEEIYKLTSNILIIGQPAHKLDLYQELRYSIDTFLMKYGDIPELDPDLDAQRKAGVSEYSIQASYFLNILDDNSLPFYHIKNTDLIADRNICFIDPAKGGADFTAIAIGGVKFNKFIVTGLAFQKTWYECIEELSYMSNVMNIGAVYIETNGLGDIVEKELHEAGIPAIGVNTSQNKHAKIMSVAPYVDDILLNNSMVYTDDINNAIDIFNDQVKNYEYKVKHDDAPDALSMLILKSGLI